MNKILVQISIDSVILYKGYFSAAKGGLRSYIGTTNLLENLNTNLLVGNEQSYFEELLEELF